MEEEYGRGSIVVRDYVFIADLFVEEFLGGAELVNEELIVMLQEGGNTVEKIKCADVTASFIRENKEKYFILSNFMRLNKSSKQELMKANYALYEHDHKYTINRNPAAFPEMKVPSQQLDNLELYQNANIVFCQSNIHQKAITTNIQLDNVVSLGSSLWSEEFLDEIEKISPKKTKKAAIIGDTNPIKRQQFAEDFCKNNNIEYDIIRAPSPLELARKLAEYETLVFFPQVLETFSRVAVEAKMVGCKLYTNQLLGAASEPWFSGDRESIIETMKAARKKTYDAFTKQFTKDERKLTSCTRSNITVILNAYRRPYNLEKQIESIRSQSIPPAEIWLWINDHPENHNFDFKKLKVDKLFHNDHNWKFFGRFAAALLADTEYVAIFDDDTIPGKKWFQNCLESMKNSEGIMGSAGYIQTGPRALEYEPGRCGWPAKNKETKRVDYVGHAWFFKREWLSYLWAEKPCTWDNGEDIHFSYTAQKYGNIQTYCPPHPADDLELHGSLYGYELGVDDKATSNNVAVSHEQFFSERDYCISNAIKGGWKTVYNISNKEGP